MREIIADVVIVGVILIGIVSLNIRGKFMDRYLFEKGDK